MTTFTFGLQKCNAEGEALVDGTCGTVRQPEDAISVSGNTVTAYIKKPGQGVPYCFKVEPSTSPPPLPPPSITQIIPASGSVAGGTAVTINGLDFVPGAVVTFYIFEGTSTTVVDSSTITTVTPGQEGVGLVNVTVTNPDGQSAVLVNGYSYESVTPNELWEPVHSGPGQPIWTGTAWYLESGNLQFYLKVKEGSLWSGGFSPTHARITYEYTGALGTCIPGIFIETGGSVSPASSGMIISLSNPSISELWITMYACSGGVAPTAITVTNIEFKVDGEWLSYLYTLPSGHPSGGGGGEGGGEGE
jgi:hypothetical protein